VLYIAVVGGSDCTKEERELARDTGREVARLGGTVICGGGAGVMEAVSEGAREAGGDVLGILPGSDHRLGNRHLSFSIATGLGEARNAIISRTADAVIAIGGEYGTLSEIALALKMNKPVIGIKSWSLQKPGQFTGPGIIGAGSAKEAVNLAVNAAGAE